MNILFHSNQLSERGTEIALFDYAHFNETMLNNKSFIICKNLSEESLTYEDSVTKFKNRFTNVFTYTTHGQLEDIIKNLNIDFLYTIKAGINDGVYSNKVKTGIHVVFQYYQPHGDVYAYISKWLSDKMSNGKNPYVPHMINLPNHQNNLREELNIPKTARVFGRYGGKDTFNIPYVLETIKRLETEDVYFIFMNTNKFTSQKNVIFLNPTTDMSEKVKFINTCDCMLHARSQGESFGIAVGEFSIKNKPILTSTQGRDRAHYEILGDKGLYYSNAQQLEKLLTSDIDFSLNWNSYSNYNPTNIMNTFKKVFLS
jgi:hypothetical protein